MRETVALIIICLVGAVFAEIYELNVDILKEAECIESFEMCQQEKCVEEMESCHRESRIDMVVYTGFVNIVNSNFHFPLIGFVNMGLGSQSMPQLGFVNWTQNNFESTQLGLINNVGRNFNGVQLGYINLVSESLNGTQLGFVNFIRGNVQGMQVGYVNIALNDLSGLQIGFVNLAHRVDGMQLGFVNIAESVDNGIPIGFVSIVREGGYRAIGMSVSELAPYNMAFKIGVERFYTSFNLAYKPDREAAHEASFAGWGVGTIVRFNDVLFLNPELISMNNVGKHKQNHTSFVPNLGFRITSGLSIIVGPSFTWTSIWNDSDADREIFKPTFSFKEHRINDRNRLFVGGRVGLRVQAR